MNIKNRAKRYAGGCVALLLALALSASTALAAGTGYDAETYGGAAARTPVIVIDPGHQERGNNSPEPIAPGSSEMKPRVASGTIGVATRKPEHVLNLEVSQRIKAKLEAMGYDVVMTRETHNVDISNKERAELANEVGADLFLRIHADGDTSSKTRGTSVLYPASSVSASADLYERSKQAAGMLLADIVARTETRSRGTVARDDLSGFNWSTVPNVLIEMGFMTNPEEDRLLSTEAYQEQMAEGIAAGVNRYITEATGQSPWNPRPFEQKIALTGATSLYDRSGERLVPVGAYLLPQDVVAHERAGQWVRIDTWLGDSWIKLAF